MAFPSDKNDKQFTSSRIFFPTKISFMRYHQLFCAKLEAAIHIYFVENLFLEKVLNIYIYIYIYIFVILLTYMLMTTTIYALAKR